MNPTDKNNNLNRLGGSARTPKIEQKSGGAKADKVDAEFELLQSRLNALKASPHFVEEKPLWEHAVEAKLGHIVKTLKNAQENPEGRIKLNLPPLITAEHATQKVKELQKEITQKAEAIESVMNKVNSDLVGVFAASEQLLLSLEGREINTEWMEGLLDWQMTVYNDCVKELHAVESESEYVVSQMALENFIAAQREWLGVMQGEPAFAELPQMHPFLAAAEEHLSQLEQFCGATISELKDAQNQLKTLTEDFIQAKTQELKETISEKTLKKTALNIFLKLELVSKLLFTVAVLAAAVASVVVVIAGLAPGIFLGVAIVITNLTLLGGGALLVHFLWGNSVIKDHLSIIGKLVRSIHLAQRQEQAITADFGAFVNSIDIQLQN